LVYSFSKFLIIFILVGLERREVVKELERSKEDLSIISENVEAETRDGENEKKKALNNKIDRSEYLIKFFI